MIGNGRKSGEKPRKIKFFQRFRATPKPWVVGSNPPAPAKIKSKSQGLLFCFGTSSEAEKPRARCLDSEQGKDAERLQKPQNAQEPLWHLATERRRRRPRRGSESSCPCQKIRLVSTSRIFLSKPTGLVYHHRTQCGAYHPPHRGGISSRAGVHLGFTMMIYNTSCW